MFSGRIDRKGFAIGYFLCCVPYFVLAIVVWLMPIVLHMPFNSSSLYPVTIPVLIGISLYTAAFFYPVVVGLSMRRWHDMGRSGWWALLCLWPQLGFFVAIIQALYPGEREANDYGIPEFPRSIRDIFFGGPLPTELQPSVGPPNENRP